MAATTTKRKRSPRKKPAATRPAPPVTPYAWHCRCGRLLMRLNFIPADGTKIEHKCGRCGLTATLEGKAGSAVNEAGAKVAEAG